MIQGEKQDKAQNDVAPWQQAADKAAEENNADILFLNGPIDDESSFAIIDICEQRNRRKNVIFILVTEGGSAHAAYRIARCLQELYDRFSFFASGYCKSAGTLVGIGANEIIIADRGELGPLDVQLRKEDELFQTRSGLTVLSALSTLNEHAFEAYEHFLLQMKVRSRGDITTKTAAQTAADMAGELFGRVYEHIDPMHVGEAGRSLRITHQYGQVLQRHGDNCKGYALDRLTAQYPSHSFIIDRFQAKELFKRVNAPSSFQKELIKHLGKEAIFPDTTQNRMLLAFLNKEQERENEQVYENNTQDEGAPSRTRSNGGRDSEEHKSRAVHGAPERLAKVSGNSG